MADSTSSTTNPPSNVAITASHTPTANNIPTFVHSHGIVTVKLNKDNFLLWKAQIVPYLRGQKVFGFLDGTIMPPPPTLAQSTDTTTGPTDNPDYLLWVQQDQLILSTLLSSLTEGVLTQVVGCVTSRDLWVTLERMFTSQSRARIMQIHYQLDTIKKSGSSIPDYFQKIKGLADTLAAAGQPLNDFEIGSYILAGLGPEYDPFVTSVTTRVDPLTVDELYGHLLAHESRLEQHALPTTESFPSAHLASKQSRGRGTYAGPRRGFTNSSAARQPSYSRGHRGRGRGGRPPSSPFSASLQHDGTGPVRPTCQVCNKIGHTALHCYNRFNHAYHGEQSTPPAAFLTAPSFNDYNWYPDTGATNHLTSDLNNLNIHSEEYVGTYKVQVGNGAALPILHTGFTSLPTSSQQFTLNNILHVPHITKNLISVSQFTKDNHCYLEFHPTFFCVKDQATGRILHRRPSNSGLYSFYASPTRHSPHHAYVGERATLSAWHGRLGHPALRTVRHVVSKFHLPVTPNKPPTICSACQQGKSHQLPFPTSLNKSKFPLELVFADV